MVRRKEAPKSSSFMMGIGGRAASTFTLPQRNLSFQTNTPHHHHHPKLKHTSSFLMNSAAGHNSTRTVLLSRQKQKQQQRQNQLFKVAAFILYSLGLVSLVLILLMSQRLESGKNRSFRVMFDIVRIMYDIVVDTLFPYDKSSPSSLVAILNVLVVLCFIAHHQKRRKKLPRKIFGRRS